MEIAIYKNASVYLGIRGKWTLCLYEGAPSVARSGNPTDWEGTVLEGVSSEEVLEALRVTILELAKRKRENDV